MGCLWRSRRLSSYWKNLLFCLIHQASKTNITIMKALTHWGRVTHLCVSNLKIIGPDNGLSPGRRQAIIWTNAMILLIGSLGTNFSEISIEIHTFSFKKTHFKLFSGKWRPFCLGLNVSIVNRNIKHNKAKLSLKFVSYICAYIYHTNKSQTEYIHMSTILK